MAASERDTHLAAISQASTSWEIRLRLAAMGWRTDTRFEHTRSGEGGRFTIWVERSDWHGRSDSVNVHGGCGISLDQVDHGADGDIPVMLAVVRRLGERAVRAWHDFPDSIPCQMPDGSLVMDTWNTERSFKAYPAQDRFLPTEKFPLDFENLWIFPEDPDWLLMNGQEIARLGAQYQDRLDPWRWSSPGWNKDRIWGFEHRLSFFSWNGVACDHRPIRQSTSELSAVYVDASLTSSLATFTKLLDLYKPGSPLGDLPPCIRPSIQPILRAESALQSEELKTDAAAMARDPEAMERLAAAWESRRQANPVLAREWCEMTVEHVELAVENLDMLSKVESRSAAPKPGR